MAHNGSASGEPAPAASSVSGTVSLSSPHELSDKAVLTIKLVDVSARNAEPLDSKKVSPIPSLPYQFTFNLKPDQINTADLYVVQAEIVDGIRHYTMPLQAPVLTKGASNQANIRLVAVPTPGEKMLAAYKKVEQQIGGMKVSKGTSLSKQVSRGWQVFRDKESGKVEFVRELADYGKKGFTRTDFAYKDGKPWVVVQQKKASESAKPHEIDRAGWDEQGQLVLKDKVIDGKTTTLDADTAASLHKDAEAMFTKAGKSK